MPFTNLSKLCKNADPKGFTETILSFDFSSSNFNLQSHVLNTIGVALSGFLSVYTGDALGEPAPTLIPR
jgi:hypothetical protein